MINEKILEEEIYHYCSVETLKKIIENRTLRFSDVLKSNDSEEIEFLWDKYFKYAESINVSSSKNIDIDFLKMLKGDIVGNILFLALCFSKKRDSLHMWNCYADEGISIGFNRFLLQDWAINIKYATLDSKNESCAELKDVQYFNYNEIDSFVKKECKIVKSKIDGVSKVFMNAPFCKSDFFKAEGEVRAVIRLWTHNENANRIKYGKGKEAFLGICENKYSKIVPFVDIPFRDGMLESITIGPNCKLDEKDIEQLLFVNGFENYYRVKIEKSEGSYR